jgi:hypothetical protein
LNAGHDALQGVSEHLDKYPTVDTIFTYVKTRYCVESLRSYETEELLLSRFAAYHVLVLATSEALVTAPFTVIV